MNEQQEKSVQLDSLSLPYIEELFARFQQDPQTVPPDWRDFFHEWGEQGEGNGAHRGPSFRPRSLFHTLGANGNGAQADASMRAARHQDRVDQLIRAYRVRGHLVAAVDPLLGARPVQRELSPEHYRLYESDLDTPFSTSFFGGPSSQTLREILDRLRNTYCRCIGVQFMHIDDLELREWLQAHMEETENRLDLGHDQQTAILSRLTDAVIFEQFVRKKFIGAKTYSLEGAESLIPLLHMAIERAGDDGIAEIVLGMAHRGRLNVLVNILGKNPQHVFQEFEDQHARLREGRGDVKYHMGYSGDWTTRSGKSVHLSLCFNPSHLEFVNPVALGRMRAKQDRCEDYQRQRGMVMLIHGDAGFAGQGIVQETLNLSQLDSYTTGGTLHVIVNNQLGFTTPPQQGRSSVYASDVAKMLQIPIFHVNGENPEAVAQVINLAMDFRRRFQRDVVIDMYCYRKLGHNESDEPTFTQPVMYDMIEQLNSVRDSYLQQLLDLGEITREEADDIAESRRERLEKELSLARRSDTFRPTEMLGGVWKGYLGGPEPADDQVETKLPHEKIPQLIERLTTTPESFHLHRKIERGLESRRAMGRGEEPFDWAAAEALALASIGTAGYRVRLSGQDTERGTFSQRHAIWFDQEDGTRYTPFEHLADDQAPIEVINSPLSEMGVLGFEYGYSLDYPDGLILWEAQFGDFANVAQVIIDQFIISAEDKWRRLSGLVLLLPHGFEGQGPEHSSARLERFLMLAAEDNIQIVYPTTPAQYFHVLRRQALRRWRKPLVVMTPKSLLRHAQAVSPLEEFAEGRFHRVLPDELMGDRPAERVLLCSGKVYYDLVEACKEAERDDVAIIRLEQLYPFPELQLRASLETYGKGTRLMWVQEEPENMGAWRYLKAHRELWFPERFELEVVARPASSSPATGSSSSHKLEQAKLLRQALDGEP
ncbi:MAG: 2-oxoglutarate dehydrogenase E1 component [Pirellulales bacterium]